MPKTDKTFSECLSTYLSGSAPEGGRVVLFNDFQGRFSSPMSYYLSDAFTLFSFRGGYRGVEKSKDYSLFLVNTVESLKKLQDITHVVVFPANLGKAQETFNKTLLPVLKDPALFPFAEWLVVKTPEIEPDWKFTSFFFPSKDILPEYLPKMSTPWWFYYHQHKEGNRQYSNKVFRENVVFSHVER